MIERIDPSLCTGCGICVDSCWADVIRMDEKEKKTVIKYATDCCSCGLCQIDCPEHAIEVSQKTYVYPITIWGL
jgi:NAD-dependent dihydropyrimidine dehydrogenase PreA subunit